MTAVLPAPVPATDHTSTTATHHRRSHLFRATTVPEPGDPENCTGHHAGHATVTDAELLQRHCDGCEESYGHLISRHERLLVWTLHHLRIAPGDHADILQEALLKVHRQAASFRGSGCAAAWLRTITTNTALSHLRSTGRRREDLDPREDGIDELLRRTPDVRVTDAGRTVQRLLLHDALATLRPGLREALLLSDHCGLSMEDISARTGVPVGTVKSRISRARRQLRSRLSDAGLTPAVRRATA